MPFWYEFSIFQVLKISFDTANTIRLTLLFMGVAPLDEEDGTKRRHTSELKLHQNILLNNANTTTTTD